MRSPLFPQPLNDNDNASIDAAIFKSLLIIISPNIYNTNTLFAKFYHITDNNSTVKLYIQKIYWLTAGLNPKIYSSSKKPPAVLVAFRIIFSVSFIYMFMAAAAVS